MLLWKPYKAFTKITLVGVGGGGNELAMELARVLSLYKMQMAHVIKEGLYCLGASEGLNEEPELLIIDGDIVEPKNIGRQRFLEQDVGKNKAEVVAKRVSNYGVICKYSNQYLNKENIERLFYKSGLIILCVDNDATRKIVNTFIDEHTSHTVIDCGNNLFTGQVFVYGSLPLYRVEINQRFLDLSFSRWSDNESAIKFANIIRNSYTDLCNVNPPELDKDKHPEEISCGEHIVSTPQIHLMNRVIASKAASIVENAILGTVIQPNIRFYLNTFSHKDVVESIEDALKDPTYK